MSGLEWTRRGLIYCANGESEWQQTHANIPTPWLKDAKTLRLYTAICNTGATGTPVSRIGYVDVDADDPSKVLKVSATPCLDIGADGCFDDNGVLPLCVMEQPDGSLLMAYAGFQQFVKIRYTIFSGLARSTDGGETFQRISQVPWLDRTDTCRFIRSAPWVQMEGDEWALWYVAGDTWRPVNGVDRPVYELRYLRAPAGTGQIHHDGPVVLSLQDDEFGFGRPNIWKRGDTYKMIFSVRSDSIAYKLGYAESKDGIHWQRDDSQVLLQGEVGAWESEMTCFGVPYTAGDKTYLFYNGNGFGTTGFGYAELTKGTW